MRIICVLLIALAASPVFSQEVDVTVEAAQDGVRQMGVIQMRTADENGENIQVFSTTTLGENGAFFALDSPAMFHGDKFSMLSNPVFQDELDLIEDQKKQIDDISKEFSKKMSDHFKSFKDGNIDLGNAAGIKDFMNSINEQKVAKMGEILLPHQMERLNQIALQMEMKQRGDINTLTGEKLKETLGIDDEQQEQLKERAKEIKAQLQKDIAKLREQAREDLMDELTSEQRDKLETMLGDKFEYKAPSFSERIERLRQKRKSNKKDGE